MKIDLFIVHDLIFNEHMKIERRKGRVWFQLLANAPSHTSSLFMKKNPVALFGLFFLVYVLHSLINCTKNFECCVTKLKH